MLDHYDAFLDLLIKHSHIHIARHSYTRCCLVAVEYEPHTLDIASLSM